MKASKVSTFKDVIDTVTVSCKDFIADMVVEGALVVELKAVTSLATAYEVQLVNYLTATQHDTGLLINFGPAKVDVKRKYRTHLQTRQHEVRKFLQTERDSPAEQDAQDILIMVYPVNPVRKTLNHTTSASSPRFPTFDPVRFFEVRNSK